VEIEDPNLGEMFRSVFSAFMSELKSSSEAGRLMEKKLRALNLYIDTISRSARPLCLPFPRVSVSQLAVANELLEITKEERIRRKWR
jgi:hypothetical protein